MVTQQQQQEHHLHSMSNQTIVIAFIIMFAVYYMMLGSFGSFGPNNPNTPGNPSTSGLQFFFFVALGIILYMIYGKRQQKKVDDTKNIATFIDSLEDMVSTSETSEMLIATVYKLHKPLTSLQFIKSNAEVQRTLYDLRFLLLYDKENFIDITVYTEYFLKTHFNILIGKYDPKSHIPILKDIRTELLNMIHTSHFNIPNVSTIYDSTDLDDNLKLGIKRLQAITYKLTKIVFRKYSKENSNESYHFASAFDSEKSNMYHMF